MSLSVHDATALANYAATNPQCLDRADWEIIAAHQAVIVAAELGPDRGDAFARLYARIAAGNREADEASPTRADLRTRFACAVKAATISRLGVERAGEWYAVPVRKRDAWLYGEFRLALPRKHPEIVGGREAAGNSYFQIMHRRLVGAAGAVSGAVVAAFGLDAWQEARSYG